MVIIPELRKEGTWEATISENLKVANYPTLKKSLLNQEGAGSGI